MADLGSAKTIWEDLGSARTIWVNLNLTYLIKRVKLFNFILSLCQLRNISGIGRA